MLRIGDFAYAMADGLRVGNASKLGADLAAAARGDGSALLARADLVAGARLDGTGTGTGTGIVGQLAIACLDQRNDFASVAELGGFASGLSTLPAALGIAAVPFALCVDWPWRRAAPPVAISARNAPPMLVASVANDPISPSAMVKPFLDALGNGSHLATWNGDCHVAATHSQCIRDAITDFVIDPARPPAVSQCAASE